MIDGGATCVHDSARRHERTVVTLCAAVLVACVSGPASRAAGSAAGGTMNSVGDATDSNAKPRDSAPVTESTRPELRATGNEPGWLLVITDSTTTLEWDYGDRKTSATTTAAQSMPGGRRYAFTGDTAFTVTVRDTLCADVMSGREFPARVRVTIGTRVLDGCGGPPGASRDPA